MVFCSVFVFCFHIRILPILHIVSLTPQQTMWDKAELGTANVVTSAAFYYILLPVTGYDFSPPRIKVYDGKRMTVATFLPFPPDLHLPSGVLLQPQIFKVPDSRNYASTLGSLRRNGKDAVFSCWDSNFQTLQDMCLHWR